MDSVCFSLSSHSYVVFMADLLQVFPILMPLTLLHLPRKSPFLPLWDSRPALHTLLTEAAMLKPETPALHHHCPSFSARRTGFFSTPSTVPFDLSIFPPTDKTLANLPSHKLKKKQQNSSVVKVGRNGQVRHIWKILCSLSKYFTHKYH